MSDILAYTLDTILENERLHSPSVESEEIMSLNKKKIRREVAVNGVKVWITADSEQEYVDKILRLAGMRGAPTREQHPFQPYAENWFEVFSKPNVSSVTALTYERQLNMRTLESATFTHPFIFSAIFTASFMRRCKP